MPVRNYYKPRSIRNLEKKSRRNFIISVIFVLLFIYFLINWGLPGLIGGLSIFNKTKTDQQKSIAEDVTLAPPVLNIPFEATNSSTLVINGYAASNAKVEIYLDDQYKETVDTSPDGNFKAEPVTLSLGTNNIFGKTIDENGKSSLPSKTIKINYSNEKPKLEVSEPEEDKQLKGGDKKVKVSGKTDPENNVTVNGVTIIVNSDGNFSTDQNINDGDNQITIFTTNSFGNSTQTQRKVTYTP